MLRKPLIALCILLAFGLARWPLESAATRDFKQRHILPPNLGLSLREKLGQNSYAAAFGGARSLVASIQNLMAFVAWEEQDWGLVESRYRLITELQPRVPSYWEMAAWHMAYNASGWYRFDWRGPKGADAPPAAALDRARAELWELYVRKGRDLFANGTRNNPESWKLHELAGMLDADPNKLLDHASAARYFAAAAAINGAPPRVHRFAAYELSYLPDQQAAALARLSALYAASPANHVPTLTATLLDLQFATNTPAVQRVPLAKFGATPAAIHDNLHAYTAYRRSRKSDISPRLLAFLREMESQWNIPPAERIPDL